MTCDPFEDKLAMRALISALYATLTIPNGHTNLHATQTGDEVIKKRDIAGKLGIHRSRVSHVIISPVIFPKGTTEIAPVHAKVRRTEPQICIEVNPL